MPTHAVNHNMQHALVVGIATNHKINIHGAGGFPAITVNTAFALFKFCRIPLKIIMNDVTAIFL